MSFFFFYAILAKSVEVGAAVRNHSLEVIPGSFHQCVDSLAAHINDPITAGAGEMAVRFRSAVKAVCAGSAGKLSDFADIGQQRQIPIYSSKADIGINKPKVLVYSIRSRMVGSRHKKFFDGFPLAAVFQRCHGSASFLNNNNNY